MVGKYVDLSDSYKSLNEALIHAGMHTRARVQIEYIDSETIERDGTAALAGLDAILVPGGFGKRGAEGKIAAIQYARENNVPYLGICLGMQLATIEFARHVCGLEGANSTEFDPETLHPVVALVTEWMDRDGRIERRDARSDLGGTMRLGARSARVEPGTLARRIYGDAVNERHRHRYEVNNVYVPQLRGQGHEDLGAHARPRTCRRSWSCPAIRWFVGVQFHPEFTSTPRNGHPLFKAFIEAALALRAERNGAAEEGGRMKLAGFDVGLDRPLFLIAGPCVVESESLQVEVAGRLKEITAGLGIPFIFKSSYDKANRSSGRSFRGLGIDEGLRILAEVKRQVGVPVLTDVHTRPRCRRWRGGRRDADPGVPLPADRLHPRLRAGRPAGEHQEGPVPRSRRHEERHRQGARGRARGGPRRGPLPGLRARR